MRAPHDRPGERWLVQHCQGEAPDVGTPIAQVGVITIKQAAEEIIALTGSWSRLEYRPLPEDDPRQRCPDIARARELLNWRPSVPLKAGLERTIAYFERLLAGELLAERKLVRAA